MFFNSFPTIKYYFNEDGKETTATHILRRAALVRKVLENKDAFIDYTIQEGQTPEQLSYEYYGNPYYHWIVLMANDIIDPFSQWPLTMESVKELVKDRYGEGNEFAIHHYEDAKGNWVPSGLSLYSVSNFDFENDQNELKRKIRIPKREYINQIVEENSKVYQDV